MLCVRPPLLYNHNQFHTSHTHSPRHTNTLLTFDHIKMHKIKQSTIKSKRTVLVCVCAVCICVTFILWGATSSRFLLLILMKMAFVLQYICFICSASYLTRSLLHSNRNVSHRIVSSAAIFIDFECLWSLGYELQ